MKPLFLSAKKNLGQHFLVSQKVIQSIIKSQPQTEDGILEIGPGPGVLTAPLSVLKKPFYLVEKDERFKDHLQSLVGEENLLLTDVLKVNFNQDPFSQFKDWWVVSNLPYNISVPITLNLFKTPHFKNLTLMMQKEVAHKFLPRQKNEMNSLFSLSHLFFHVELVCHVPPGAFLPPPKVDSEVLHFKRLESPLLPLGEWDKIEQFFRVVFSAPRKQLGGILKKSFPSADFLETFRKLEINPERRAETLSLKEIILLYEYFKNF
jgi:16S rRNA (adenine1518-N6/adenine1519-N6)-dimethyltransferase